MTNQIKTRWGMRDLYESEGPERFAAKIVACLQEGKLKPEDISLKELAHCIVGSPILNVEDFREAVSATAFQPIANQVITSKIMSAYELAPNVGRQLVEIIPTNNKVSRIPGFTAMNLAQELAEHELYPQDTIDAKYVDVTAQKYGRILALTDECVKEDQTGMLLRRAGQIGAYAAAKQEKVIVEGLIDSGTNVYGGAQLYVNATFGNTPAATGNLTNATLEAALVALGGMRDDASETTATHGTIESAYVGLTGKMDILANISGYLAGLKILKSAKDPDNANNTINVINEYIGNVYWSPFITTSGSWFFGNFKAEFVWLEYWPLQVFSRGGQSTEPGWERDVVYEWKIRFSGGIQAVDHRFVYKGK